MKKKIIITALVAIILTGFTTISHADSFQLWGNGGTTVQFYVESKGNALIKLQQTKGRCEELSYTKIISEAFGNAEEWDDTSFNKTFKLSLPQVGRYTIRSSKQHSQ